MKENEKSKENERSDFLPLKGIDYVEFYVGNAKQSSNYYQNAFGFKLTGYSGLESGIKDRCSYLLEQGNIRIVLTSPLISNGFISEHIKNHGDGVRDIAFEVDDSEKSFYETTIRGARPVLIPTEYKDEFGTIIISSVATYGDTIHSFIERKNYKGIFKPGFINHGSRTLKQIDDIGLKAIDHIVGNVELGLMNYWVGFYSRVLGFSQLISFDDKDISRLKNLGILVDRDEDGYLLQIFSKPVEDRPTLFFEIIQRKGARSFGKGNFKALFESIEREQALRGTL